MEERKINKVGKVAIFAFMVIATWQIASSDARPSDGSQIIREVESGDSVIVSLGDIWPVHNFKEVPTGSSL